MAQQIFSLRAGLGIFLVILESRDLVEVVGEEKPWLEFFYRLARIRLKIPIITTISASEKWSQA